MRHLARIAAFQSIYQMDMGKTDREEAEDEEKNEEGRKYLLRERRHVSFERSFTLPDDLNEEGITASFKNGILEISLPKIPKAEPKRIEVKLN